MIFYGCRGRGVNKTIFFHEPERIFKRVHLKSFLTAFIFHRCVLNLFSTDLSILPVVEEMWKPVDKLIRLNFASG